MKSTGTTISYAQRRPERKLRRQAFSLGDRLAVLDHRSTKAGAQTPATDQFRAFGRAHVPGRSTKAGAQTPATVCTVPGPLRWAHALNEGRSANSGDSFVCPLHDIVPCQRSTKAGAQTPATGRHAFTEQTGVVKRSTKAGAQTPATAAVSGRQPSMVRTAQRRPERKLRRQSRACGRLTYCVRSAQRRPERKLRRQDRDMGISTLVKLRSTKAGAQTPATGSPRTSGENSTNAAQRRPERKLRRQHLVQPRQRASVVNAQRRPERKLRRQP